jgi:pyruvate ferredoxin oxidoreductase delta subunit
MSDPTGWKSIPIGGLIVKPGNSHEYKTGSWRTYRPVLDEEKCINCHQCWIYCPDSSIMIVDEKMTGFDYDHCKGCGICSEVCPPKVQAIKMVLENE